MIDVSQKHPYSASAEFVVHFLERLADHDFRALEEMVDANEAGLAIHECFPVSEDRAYMRLIEADRWSFSILCNDREGFLVDVTVPLDSVEWPHTYVRFKMQHQDNSLRVILWEVLPHENPQPIDLIDTHVRPSRMRSPSREK